MKLEGGLGCRERVQDTCIIKAAVRIRRTVDSRWRVLLRPLYFVVTPIAPFTFDDEDLHDWEIDLLDDSLLATMRVTKDQAIIGISTGKKPIPCEDFTSGFVPVHSSELTISDVMYRFQAFGLERK